MEITFVTTGTYDALPLALTTGGALLTGVAVYPFARKIALRFNVVDHPTERKLHRAPIPYLGSLIIYFGFLVGALIYFVGFKGYLNPPFREAPEQLIGIGLSATLMCVLGIVDDKYNVPAWWKLGIQVLIAIIPLFFGIYIKSITNPLGGGILILWKPFAYVATVFWLVGLANAINLIDGLDGLAAGICAIATLFLVINAAMLDSFMTYPMAALFGCLVAFLIFNFPPAKIFMGDSGALFLGYTIGVFSLVSNLKSAFAISLLLPVVLLLIPILDTLLSILRRVKAKTHPFTADNEHLHYRLLFLGNSPKSVLGIMYAITVFLGILSIVSYMLPAKEYTIIMIFFLVVVFFLGVELVETSERRRKDQIRFERIIEKQEQEIRALHKVLTDAGVRIPERNIDNDGERLNG